MIQTFDVIERHDSNMNHLYLTLTDPWLSFLCTFYPRSKLINQGLNLLTVTVDACTYQKKNTTKETEENGRFRLRRILKQQR